MLIMLTGELSTISESKRKKSKIKPDEKVKVESQKKFNKPEKSKNMKMIRVADLFSDLIDISDYDESADVVEIRDNIRERKI